MTIEQMRQRKQELGYSYETLERLSGVPYPTLQKIFSGKTRNPRQKTIAALQNVLAVADATASQTHHEHTTYEATREGLVDSTGGIFGKEDTTEYGTDRIVRENTAPYYTDKGQDLLDGQAQGHYTVKDYRSIDDGYRYELMDGILTRMEAPSSIHQAMQMRIIFALFSYIQAHNGTCEVFGTPLDVQLNQDEHTMLQPDVTVVCDHDKIHRQEIWGAPDLIVEIMSPSTSRRDMVDKRYKYARAGVREYWIVDIRKKYVIVCDFVNDQESIYPFMKGSQNAKVPVGIWEGKCVIDFAQLYQSVQYMDT